MAFVVVNMNRHIATGTVFMVTDFIYYTHIYTFSHL